MTSSIDKKEEKKGGKKEDKKGERREEKREEKKEDKGITSYLRRSSRRKKSQVCKLLLEIWFHLFAFPNLMPLGRKIVWEQTSVHGDF